MRQYLVKLENNTYLPAGTRGHGFHGYLDLSLNDPGVLEGQAHVKTVLAAAAKASGQDPNNIIQLTQADLNNDSPTRDQETGIFGLPAHKTPTGRRVSARDAVVEVLNAKTVDGVQRYKLTVSLHSLATKVLFAHSQPPRATGVEYLQGQSMYSADPRYNASEGVLRRAFARREVIIAGGVFNSPQLLKLSGIGPTDELAELGIRLLRDSLASATTCRTTMRLVSSLAHRRTSLQQDPSAPTDTVQIHVSISGIKARAHTSSRP